MVPLTLPQKVTRAGGEWERGEPLLARLLSPPLSFGRCRPAGLSRPCTDIGAVVLFGVVKGTIVNGRSFKNG
jgi:hypothetical protein